jgi:hypothetical protein
MTKRVRSIPSVANAVAVEVAAAAVKAAEVVQRGHICGLQWLL